VITSIVTGGAGFLGSHLVDVLIKRGESVIVFDNLATGQLANLERAISSGRATFVYANGIRDAAALRPLLTSGGVKTVDAVYHFAVPKPAASAAAAWDEAPAAQAVSVGALIDIALEYRARFILASPATLVVEDGDETAVSVAASTQGLDARIGRFFDCYGPRMHATDGALVPALCEAAVNRRPFPIEGSGEDLRSLTFVADALNLLLRIADAPRGAHAPVDIGSDEHRSALEITRTFARTARLEFNVDYVPARALEPGRRAADGTRARALGWKPSTSLEDGLRITYDWFSRENRQFV
jgi:nucleoside-diphosphate-sugar epimerase